MKYIARNDDDKNGFILHVPHHIMADSRDAASDAHAAAVCSDNNL
jgi:hypothetical protein